jgi:hypothetical protein
MPSAVAPLPASVTAGQIAKATGLTERTVYGRKSSGQLPTHDDGGIDFYPIVKAGVEALASGRDGGLEEARIREIKLKGDKLELVNAQLRADLIPADEMEAIVGGACDAARTKILALPSSVAARLAAMRSPADVQEALTKALHEALADLASVEIADAVKDRARSLARRSEADATAGPEDGAA